MGFVFEKLEAYDKAVEFANKVLFLTRDLSGEYNFPVKRLGEAALCISLNIAEDAGRLHQVDRQDLFREARTACFKCVPLLTFLKCDGFIGPLTCAALKADVENIEKMLVSLINGKQL